jgi:hypothetical protein
LYSEYPIYANPSVDILYFGKQFDLVGKRGPPIWQHLRKNTIIVQHLAFNLHLWNADPIFDFSHLGRHSGAETITFIQETLMHLTCTKGVRTYRNLGKSPKQAKSQASDSSIFQLGSSHPGQFGAFFVQLGDNQFNYAELADNIPEKPKIRFMLEITHGELNAEHMT